jgi:hypothetical protein
MKYEWRKAEKELYLPKEKPVIVTVPKHKFFAVKGAGDPNKPEFAERLGALYTLSYAVRMMPKTGFVPPGFYEYAVFPLEGLWEGTGGSDKDKYEYNIMIRQPDFVDAAITERAMAAASKKVSAELLAGAFVTEIEDGLSVQMMHAGDYDDETRSFLMMEAFMAENGLTRRGSSHREIYMSDPRKVARDKLRTVLRLFVDHQGSKYRG